MNTSEHPAAHAALTPHLKYWGEVKSKAEECVKHVLAEGNHHTSLHEVLGRDAFKEPEDWDTLMAYCRANGAVCHDLDRLYRASANWLQAHNELEYKRHYPGV